MFTDHIAWKAGVRVRVWVWVSEGVGEVVRVWVRVGCSDGEGGKNG